MAPDLSNRHRDRYRGSGFLGRGYSGRSSAAGCKVVILDCVVDTPSSDSDVIRIACDLVDPVATEVAVRRAWDEAGPIQILVNAVGLIQNAPLVNVTAKGDRRHSFETWRSTIDANLTSVFLATVNHVDRMVALRTRGVVVSLSSVAAAGNAGQAAYSAAKAGVNAMTLAWAKELGLLGIRSSRLPRASSIPPARMPP